MNKPFFGLLLFVSVLFQSCGHRMTPAAFRQYVEDPANGFVQAMSTGTCEIRCTYLPPAYLALRSFRGGDIEKAEYGRREAEYGGMDTYRLEVTAADGRMPARLGEYFSYYMQADIVQTCGTDTLPCTAYLAEPYNGVDRKQNIEIGFAPCGGAPTLWLPGAPFGTEALSLRFDKKDLTIPTISLR